jgi:hypothetical protein
MSPPVVLNYNAAILKFAKIILKIAAPDRDNLGVVEKWSIGVMEKNSIRQHSNTPLLHFLSGNIYVLTRNAN